ncbi:MAG: hypothetical protein ACT452_01680 [Microthrixaceae bacterium]
MRKIFVAAMTAGLLAVAAPALAAPPDTIDSETNNEVSCGTGAGGTLVPGSSIQVNTAGDAGGGGAVVCADGAPAGPVPAPIQGRVILSGTQNGAGSSGYIAADGDRSNPAEAEGWARVDFSSSGVTVKCGPDAPENASTPRDSQSQAGNQANCQP